MTTPNSSPTPVERASDLDRIERALRAAVRDALQRHKRDGDPVAVWREGRVVWLSPEQIPTAGDESSDGKENGTP
jgi:phage/plasmid-associated DNA primase